MDEPRVVAVKREGTVGWRVFFNVPVRLRGIIYTTPFTTNEEYEELPHPDAHYYYYAENEHHNHFKGDALGAFMWGQEQIRLHKEKEKEEKK
jgi:hypothetical protein